MTVAISPLGKKKQLARKKFANFEILFSDKQFSSTKNEVIYIPCQKYAEKFGTCLIKLLFASFMHMVS